jgi:hypothetical protein
MAWYVFGVVGASAAVDGVELVVEDPVAAVVATVPLSEFGEENLGRQLEDRAWVIARAREHEEVLERVHASTAVVPFRFGAIYRDVEGVRAMLCARADELAASLGRLHGCVEIGVKMWADPERFTAAQPAGATSGRDYLDRLQAHRVAAHDASTRLRALAHGTHARLRREAVAGIVNAQQPRELTGRHESMILNAAYLVNDGGDRLLAELTRLREGAPDGVAYEATGPWPPHNFVEVEEEA